MTHSFYIEITNDYRIGRKATIRPKAFQFGRRSGKDLFEMRKHITVTQLSKHSFIWSFFHDYNHSWVRGKASTLAAANKQAIHVYINRYNYRYNGSNRNGFVHKWEIRNEQ